MQKMESKTPLGAEFRRLRESFDLTQYDMADMLSLSQGTVSKIERGEIDPPFSILVILKDNFGVDLNEFVCL